MQVPEWLNILHQWQLVLNPLITVLIVLLIKPIKIGCIWIYNKYISKPDKENKTEIGMLRDEIDKLRDDIKKDINLINNDITEINTSLEQITEHRNTVQKTHIALLHNALFEKCEKAIRKGSISKDELKNIESLYKPYHSIGGNGTAEKLYHDCQILPLRTKEED